MEFSPEISGAVVGVGVGVVGAEEVLGGGEAEGKGEVTGGLVGEDGETFTPGDCC